MLGLSVETWKSSHFQTMLENYTFLPFSVFLAIFWVFTYKKVPETKNKTFDEIATLFKIQNKQKYVL